MNLSSAGRAAHGTTASSHDDKNPARMSCCRPMAWNTAWSWAIQKPKCCHMEGNVRGMNPLKPAVSSKSTYQAPSMANRFKAYARLYHNLTRYGVLMAVIRAHCLRLPMSLVFWLAGLGAVNTLCTAKELLERQEQRAEEALPCAMCSCIVLVVSPDGCGK